jgi:hypothetical protein
MKSLKACGYNGSNKKHIILEVKPFSKCEVVRQRRRYDNIKMDLQDKVVKLGGDWCCPRITSNSEFSY